MTRKVWWLVVVSLVVLSMLVACKPASNAIEYGMTEAEAAQMAEKGFINVDYITDASRIAGYPLAVPTYVPEGFIGGVFSVSQLGATLPEGVGSKVKPVNVYRDYRWQKDQSVRFQITQYNLRLGFGGSEPAEFCGRSGQRYYRKAEGDMPAFVVLGWEVDGISYYLSGTIAGQLDEAMLEKIACSIEVE